LNTSLSCPQPATSGGCSVTTCHSSGFPFYKAKCVVQNKQCLSSVMDDAAIIGTTVGVAAVVGIIIGVVLVVTGIIGGSVYAWNTFVGEPEEVIHGDNPIFSSKTNYGRGGDNPLRNSYNAEEQSVDITESE